jgi:ribosome-associated heat shock protein Hsp15
LCYARFVKHRAKAQDLIAAGHVRVNGKRIEKASIAVKPEDVLTLVLPGSVRVVQVLAEPERRGPARDAQLLYRDISSPQKLGATDLTLC